MSEPAHKSEPVRIPDHDLDDLVATVTRLVAESRKQGETLALLTDDHPSQEDDDPGDADRPEPAASPPSRAAGDPNAPRRRSPPPSSSWRSPPRRTPKNWRR